jgi:hypothetical protein
MPSFSDQLENGKVGESLVAQWLKTKGYHILPIYEIADKQYKGPALYCCDGHDLVAPDMAVFRNGKVSFIEVKYKTGFSWYRKMNAWVTGIDSRHYDEYLKMRGLLAFPLWILFLQKGGSEKDSGESPSGLFGNEIDMLSKTISHRSERWGASGMVYWNIKDLQLIANYPLTTDVR